MVFDCGKITGKNWQRDQELLEHAHQAEAHRPWRRPTNSPPPQGDRRQRRSFPLGFQEFLSTIFAGRRNQPRESDKQQQQQHHHPKLCHVEAEDRVGWRCELHQQRHDNRGRAATTAAATKTATARSAWSDRAQFGAFCRAWAVSGRVDSAVAWKHGRVEDPASSFPVV